MKKWTKRLLACASLVCAGVVLTGCTKSFCSVQDKASQMGVYERENITKINEQAEKAGVLIPQPLFNKYIELKVDEYVETAEYDVKLEDFDTSEHYVEYKRDVAKYAGKNEKGKDEIWANFDTWYNEFISFNEPSQEVKEIIKDGDISTWTLADFKVSEGGIGGPMYAPSTTYINNYYKTALNSNSRSIISCLTPSSGMYGTDGNQVYIEGKTWGQAFTEYGFIEGLLVYPVGYLLHTFSNTFGVDGFGQVISILLVTLIVRLIIVIASFSSTLSQSRMSEIQPQLAQLQSKYPNSNTSTYEKQQLAQEQMLLYKKNKIHPFRQIIVMIVQFPIFIAVWGAMQGSAILTQGSVFGLQLTSVTYNAIIGFNSETPFAIILILMMSIAQFISSKLPQWIQKWKTDKFTEKVVKSEAMEKQAKTMKMVSTVMLAVIIFMGFTLPAAMGIYWFFGAIISIIQTVLMECYQTHNRHKKGRRGPTSRGTSVKTSIIRRGKKQ